jgi:hypothetical protein
MMILIVYGLMYVIAPAILLSAIGGWTFLIYVLWIVGSFLAMQKSCEDREHMPMMEHTEAIGHMMFIAIPGILSAFVFLIIYAL